MDVERLMRDLTISQLIEIQSSLSKEAEDKKEHLRQMVGRRYRDVLDASNVTRRLTEISTDLSSQLHSVRDAISQPRTAPNAIAFKRQPVYRFALLNRILPTLGGGEDVLSDVFALILAENLHRSISIEPFSQDSNLSGSLHAISTQLIAQRLITYDQLVDELGRQSSWSLVSGQLAALGLLKQVTVDELLTLFLHSKKGYVDDNLKSSISLLGIIQMMKDTVQCIDDVFGQGRAIVSALKTVASPGWCPDSLMLIANDLPFAYKQIFSEEITKVNYSYSHRIETLELNVIEKKCHEWMNEVCSLAKDRIKGMCEYFEKSEQIVEFVMAVKEIFKYDWPSIVSNSSVYHQLFGHALLDRFKALISNELLSIEKEMLANYERVNSNPLPLFHKRAAKFDTLSTSSISPELHDLIQKTFERIKELWTHVNKYVNIGSEENIADLHDALADSILDMIQRLVNNEDCVSQKKDSDDYDVITQKDESSKWLLRFRLFLALIQHEPSILAQCVSRSAAKIEQSNKLLHSAAENSLCRFMDYLVDETARESEVSLMRDFCRQPTRWLDLVQATEKVQLEDAGTIEVPTQLSRHLYVFLHNICRKINQNSIGHLFTRNVTNHITNRLGSILSDVMKQCAEECVSTPIVCTQLLFDSKALFLMFPNKQFIEAANTLEGKIDPFDLKILSTPLSKNAKLFTLRTYMLFGQLQTETIGSSKDTSLSSSYTALVDIAPKITNTPRLGLIPRLSKLKEEERPLKQKQLNAVQSQSNIGKSPSASSFSSFLTDKFTSNWFKS